MDKSKILQGINKNIKPSPNNIKRTICLYGNKCYRKNPDHFEKYFHPTENKEFDQLKKIKQQRESSSSTAHPDNQKQSQISSYFKRKKLDGDQNPSKDEQQMYSLLMKNNCGISNLIVNDRNKLNHLSSLSKKNFSDMETKNNNNKLSNDKNYIENSDCDNEIIIQDPLVTECKNTKIFKQLDRKQFEDLHKKLFLTPIPSDIFLFWDFCKEISIENPENSFIETLGLKLVGPFDILKRKLCKDHIENENVLSHWRFYYDPPEFQTFAIIENECDLKLDAISSEYHLGYFRDSPDDDKPVIVSNDSKKTCQITGEADNIFSAIYLHLHDKKFLFNDTRFKCKINNMKNKLKNFAAKHQIDLELKKKLKERAKKINAPTLNRFGIIVNVVNDVGYRSLPKSDEDLMKLFKRIMDLEDNEKRRNSLAIEEIHQIINLINFANDEKDFGMGLEFGLDLFCTGHPFFYRTTEYLLSKAYEFLGRKSFATIIKIHINNRKHYPELSFI